MRSLLPPLALCVLALSRCTAVGEGEGEGAGKGGDGEGEGEGGVCFDRCGDPPLPASAACADAAAALPAGDGSPVLPAEAGVIDFGAGRAAIAEWVVGCDCLQTPLALRVARHDVDGAVELTALGPARLEDGGTRLLVELPGDAVTFDSTWALQTVDADGRRTSAICAPTEFRGP